MDAKCACGSLCFPCSCRRAFQDRLSLGSCLFSAAVLFSSQVGSTNSAVPSAPAYNSHEFWSSLSPAGLSDVVKDLCDALRPHLNSQ